VHAPNNNPPPVVLGLRTGCCPDPVPGPGGRTVRHLIHGYEYKNATDEQGNYHSGGAERDVPWVAIAPVVNAVRVLERMVPDGHLLFDHHAHDLHMKRRDTGSLKMSALRERIEDFVTWANHEAASHCLTGEVIPADPHGNIGLARFRRSLAWHIARRPNGLVALAIQYGHLRTTFISEGYAARRPSRARNRGRSVHPKLRMISTRRLDREGHADTDEPLEILVLWHDEQPPSRWPPQRPSNRADPMTEHVRHTQGKQSGSVPPFAHEWPRWGRAAGSASDAPSSSWWPMSD
jgi:hypothetical protein